MTKKLRLRTGETLEPPEQLIGMKSIGAHVCWHPM